VELPQPLLQRGAVRDAVERAPGGGVLRVGPALHVGRVGVLEPAVGIGNVDAVQVIDDVILVRRDRGRSGGGGHGPAH
jgi:hypothetical protein